MKTLIIIDTYPSSSKKYQELIDCVDSLKPTGLDILVTSHYPVGQDVQQKINYYIYDSNNLLIPYFVRYWYCDESFDMENWTPYHGPAISLSWYNGFNFAKLHEYEFVVYISSDCIFSPEDSHKLVELIKFCIENKKKGFVFNPQDWFVVPCDKAESGRFLWETLMFGFSVEDFLLHFSPAKTIEEYENLPCYERSLETIFYNKLQPLREEIYIIDLWSSHYFSQSQIDLSNKNTIIWNFFYNNQNPDTPVFFILSGGEYTIKLYFDDDLIFEKYFYPGQWYHQNFTLSNSEARIELWENGELVNQKIFHLDQSFPEGLLETKNSIQFKN